jgi:hypothetical protein
MVLDGVKEFLILRKTGRLQLRNGLTVPTPLMMGSLRIKTVNASFLTLSALILSILRPIDVFRDIRSV